MSNVGDIIKIKVGDRTWEAMVNNDEQLPIPNDIAIEIFDTVRLTGLRIEMIIPVSVEDFKIICEVGK